MSAYLIVICWLVGFVFFISFSNYKNLKQGNLKKRIPQNNPSLCVKLLTEDTFKPSTIWWSRQPTVTVKSLSNDNGDVNKNGKRRSRFNKPNNNFTRAPHYFVHFFTVAERLQRKKCLISARSRTRTQDFNFLFLYMNFGKAGLLEFNSRNICQHLTN